MRARPAKRSTALHGLTGALAFLVLAQAYRLLTGGGPTLAVLFAVALAVGVVAALVALADRRLVS